MRSTLIVLGALVVSVAGCGEEPRADREPPSVPSGLVVAPLVPGRMQVDWLAAVDDRAVAGYRVLRNEVQIAEVSAPGLLDAALAPGLYCYAVAAFDAAGNASEFSEPVCAALGSRATLQNDAFVTDATVYFQQGFVAGEGAGVTLGPVSHAAAVVGVELLFGGAAGVQSLTLTLARDSGQAAPGAELFATPVELTAADDAMQTIDLTSEAITLEAGASLRVNLGFAHAGLPSVARDGGPIAAGRNWLYAGGGWADSALLGLTGNWVIRAVVDFDG